MIDIKKCAFLSALVATLLFASTASANLITNGDFETGDLSGWTVFTTADGTNGIPPAVTSFDTTGGGASRAARFRVGRDTETIGTPEGGGIFQNINVLAAGILNIGLDIASDNDSVFFNADGGLFALLFDNVVVDSFGFGEIDDNSTERAALAAAVNATAGLHEIRIVMTRGFGQSSSTPDQYIDNVVATTASQISEPGTLAILGLGLTGLGFMRRRKAA
ncbi:PEP-CTERM sorting domain-containing protein [Pelagibius sp. Alg239-R121]|uniref:PEP-CTERM sorting domain-containing protein n=1 Tax=Pelagibius sp. Alg239-R121 TaxID=2993448 RepID=UPI0024A64C1B|nr:PEP-CTERM sorting domain-containing protein [Pelagibius sp. Alg239-R121]